MISFNRDGSVTFISDTNSTVTQTVAAGTPTPTIDTLYAAFVAANPLPGVLQTPQIVVLPTVNPGLTGALFLNNSTLQVSLGPTGTAQIGAAGPTGPTLGILHL